MSMITAISGIEMDKCRMIDILNRKLLPIVSAIMCDFENFFQEKPPKSEVNINATGQVCVNGTPIGHWKTLCCFERDNLFIKYYCGKKTRIIAFGMPFDNDDFWQIHEIVELDPSNTSKVVYERHKGG